MRWGLDGVRGAVNGRAYTTERWADSVLPENDTKAGWKARCLARDRAMVDALPADARVVALVAPWSRTGGALYTARHAERRGLVVTVETCPAEYEATTERSEGR